LEGESASKLLAELLKQALANHCGSQRPSGHRHSTSSAVFLNPNHQSAPRGYPGARV